MNFFEASAVWQLTCHILILSHLGLTSLSWSFKIVLWGSHTLHINLWRRKLNFCVWIDVGNFLLRTFKFLKFVNFNFNFRKNRNYQKNYNLILISLVNKSILTNTRLCTSYIWNIYFFCCICSLLSLYKLSSSVELRKVNIN